VEDVNYGHELEHEVPWETDITVRCEVEMSKVLDFTSFIEGLNNFVDKIKKAEFILKFQ